MKCAYYHYFDELKSLSLDITKESCGKIFEAVLQIEQSSGVHHNLTLKSPKPSTAVRDLSSGLTTGSVDSFKVFGEQHEPGLRDSDVLWRIELWKNSTLKDSTIHCNAIEGLPEEGWKNPPLPNHPDSF
jgi:hypothetical protein